MAATVTEQECLVSDEGKTVMMIHPDRGSADPKEGFRRGSRGALRKSCDTCTASKTKCMGSIPCDRCKKRRIECKFSKRRRCGPKARADDEKRPRTTMSTSTHNGHVSDQRPESPVDVNNANNVDHRQEMPRPLSPPLPPISSMGIDIGGGGGLPAATPKLCGPLHSDGLSSLVELIAPTLRDTGSSGSSGSSISTSINAGISSSCHGGGGGESAYSRYATLPSMNPDGASPFLGGAGPTPPPPHHLHGRGGGGDHLAGLQPSSVSAVAALSRLSSAAMDHGMRQAGDERASLAGSRSAPPLGAAASVWMLPCPPQDLPPRAKSLEEFSSGGGGGGSGGDGHVALFPQGAPLGSLSNGYIGVDGDGGRAYAASTAGTAGAGAVGSTPPRGALPLSLDRRSKEHLRAFMRTVGSIVLLPGADAIRNAVFGDGYDGEDVPNAAGADSGGTRAETGDEAGGIPGGRPAAVGGGGGEGDGGDSFVEACRAEAWAAAAVGAIFSGAAEEEGKNYVSLALRAMSRCLDAPVPEIAAAMILLALFWTHSVDKRKVARYFGFAQQVGLELGPLMPEGLRHTIAFVSSLVTMTLNLDQAPSFAVEVRDHAVWGVSLLGSSSSSRPGADPFILALSAATVACNEMLRDGADRAGAVGLMGTGKLPPPMPPSQTVTDVLVTAAKALRKLKARDGNQNPEHMLALLFGLRGYTHAARGELQEAEAAARLMLEIIDRHAAVLNLPLTFTLAEASRKLLQATAERSGRPAPTGLHVEALRGARVSMKFAGTLQSVQADDDAADMSAASGSSGGWCTFGDDIFAAFNRLGHGGGGGGGGDASAEVGGQSHGAGSRSMSPPPRRSARSLPRAVIASQRWKPTIGGIPAVPVAASGGGSDWVDRVRRMPAMALSSRPASPNVVHRMTGGGGSRPPSPTGDGGPSAPGLGLLNPGPMPAGPPNAGIKYASEPPSNNLALLSTVASPGGFSLAPQRSSLEDRHGVDGGQQGGRHRRPVGRGGTVSDRDVYDPPPPANPGLTAGISFDPNRDDGTLPFSLGSS